MNRRRASLRARALSGCDGEILLRKRRFPPPLTFGVRGFVALRSAYRLVRVVFALLVSLRNRRAQM